VGRVSVLPLPYRNMIAANFVPVVGVAGGQAESRFSYRAASPPLYPRASA
jgi:hypothetical protein